MDVLVAGIYFLVFDYEFFFSIIYNNIGRSEAHCLGIYVDINYF